MCLILSAAFIVYELTIIIIDIKNLGCRLWIADFNAVFELFIVLIIATTLTFAEQVVIRRVEQD